MSKSMENFEKKWAGTQFESSCFETNEFKSFASALKRALSKDAKENGIEVLNFSKGHFQVSGFLKKNQKYIYWSIPDVRFTNTRLDAILYREAMDASDFRGGYNHFTHFGKLLESAEKFF